MEFRIDRLSRMDGNQEQYNAESGALSTSTRMNINGNSSKQKNDESMAPKISYTISDKREAIVSKNAAIEPIEGIFRRNSIYHAFPKNGNIECNENWMLPTKNTPMSELLNSSLPLMPYPIIAEAAAVVKEAAQQNVTPPFDPTIEQMKLLKFLEPKKNAVLKKDAKLVIKCENCNNMFDIPSFNSHVCDYDYDSDDHNNLIKPADSNETVKNQNAKGEPFVPPPQPPCIRLVKENLIRIRRFLKDELRYDVITSSNSTTSSINDTARGTGTSTACGGPHECTMCERKFVHASGLLRHLEKHDLDLIPNPNAPNSSTTRNNSLNNNDLRVVVKCTLCYRIFFDPDSALQHLWIHFPGDRFQERDMDAITETWYDTYVDDAINFLKMESKADHSPPTPNNCYYPYKQPGYLKMVVLNCVLQCEFCDFIFSDVTNLLLHSAHHLPERCFECFACNIHVRTSKEICNHWQVECVFVRETSKLQQANIQRFFVCNVCDNKFQTLDHLHEHRYAAHHFFPRLNKRLDILQLPCELCSEVFENAADCINHYEDKHYRKYKRDKDGCSSIPKTRQYLCHICGKSYTQSSHLWQHLRFHQGVKPFACKEPGCTRKFTIRPDLNDHIRKCHTGERPYHCLTCGKRFLTGSVFYQHRLIHRGERRYECEECGKRFYRADALKNHQRIHTGEKPFGCLFCTKNFRQRGDRDKHIRARHSHLDAKTRLMMQKQKQRLEAAAAAAAAAAAEMYSDQPNHVLASINGQHIQSNPMEIAVPTVTGCLENNDINHTFLFIQGDSFAC